MAKKVYLVENLDCANCAAKVEAALNALPEVQEAVLTYATMQLRITAEDPDALLPKLQEVAQKVEPGVEFYPRDGAHSHGGEQEQCGEEKSFHIRSVKNCRMQRYVFFAYCENPAYLCSPVCQAGKCGKI